MRNLEYHFVFKQAENSSCDMRLCSFNDYPITSNVNANAPCRPPCCPCHHILMPSCHSFIRNVPGAWKRYTTLLCSRPVLLVSRDQPQTKFNIVEDLSISLCSHTARFASQLRSLTPPARPSMAHTAPHTPSSSSRCHSHPYQSRKYAA